jgi:ribosomal protein S18 acetylase RimI-like enzyme
LTAAEAVRRQAEAPVRAGRAEIDAAALDLAAAFTGYPMFDWLLRDDARRPTRREALFRLMLREIGFPNGKIVRPVSGGAAAVWIDSERLGPNPLLQELRGLPTLIGATGWRRFPRMLALRREMDRHHPIERPHAYLWLLGVHPRIQGLGVGSRLLAATLRELDVGGRAAFLETSTESNVALYRRHGFEVTGHYLIQPGSPPTWTMWREPQP